MWSWPVIVVCVIGALAAGFAELALDIRAPRSALSESHVVTTDYSVRIANFAETAQVMRDRYGPDAATTFQTSPRPRWVVELHGKIVHEEPLQTMFNGALGFIVIGAPGKIASMFPFRLDPQEAAAHHFSLAKLRDRLSDAKDPRIPRLLAFNDAATAEGPCVELEPTDAGSVGKLLHLRRGTFCISDWTGVQRGSALIGAVLADGDPWMRPFAGRICRSLTTLALRKIAAVRLRPPNYAACLLADRPTRRDDQLTIHVYEVGVAGVLARIDAPTSRGLLSEAVAALE